MPGSWGLSIGEGWVGLESLDFSLGSAVRHHKQMLHIALRKMAVKNALALMLLGEDWSAGRDQEHRTRAVSVGENLLFLFQELTSVSL